MYIKELINGFVASQSKVKAAAYMMPGFINIANSYSVGTSANNWIAASQFDYANDYGVAGEYGGTYSEFVTQFKTWNGVDPEPLATVSIYIFFFIIIILYFCDLV